MFNLPKKAKPESSILSLEQRLWFRGWEEDKSYFKLVILFLINGTLTVPEVLRSMQQSVSLGDTELSFSATQFVI
jgi:hypothetical protein